MPPEAEWLSGKFRDLRPGNSLRVKSMIDWFRSRKCQETAEVYLHSEEELTQKRLVQQVIQEMGQVKEMNMQLRNLQKSTPIQELTSIRRFNKYKPNPNPFFRTYGDWTDPKKQGDNFDRT